MTMNHHLLVCFSPSKKKETIYQRCINVLLTEVYKYLNGYSPDLMNEVFYLHQNYCNLRNFDVFATDNPRKKTY